MNNTPSLLFFSRKKKKKRLIFMGYKDSSVVKSIYCSCREPFKSLTNTCLYPWSGFLYSYAHKGKKAHTPKNTTTKKLLNKLKYLCIYVCAYSHVSMCPWRPEEGTGPLEAGGEDSCMGTELDSLKNSKCSNRLSHCSSLINESVMLVLNKPSVSFQTLVAPVL